MMTRFWFGPSERCLTDSRRQFPVSCRANMHFNACVELRIEIAGAVTADHIVALGMADGSG